MPQNTIRFQKGLNLPEFFQDYGTKDHANRPLSSGTGRKLAELC